MVNLNSIFYFLNKIDFIVKPFRHFETEFFHWNSKKGRKFIFWRCWVKTNLTLHFILFQTRY